MLNKRAHKGACFHLLSWRLKRGQFCAVLFTATHRKEKLVSCKNSKPAVGCCDDKAPARIRLNALALAPACGHSVAVASYKLSYKLQAGFRDNWWQQNPRRKCRGTWWSAGGTLMIVGPDAIHIVPLVLVIGAGCSTFRCRRYLQPLSCAQGQVETPRLVG